MGICNTTNSNIYPPTIIGPNPLTFTIVIIFCYSTSDWLKIIPGKPTLGICLGLQLLLDSSEESPGVDGLGIIPGKVKRLKATQSIRVPHIGWNRIIVRKEPYFSGFAYFNHTFYCDVFDTSSIIASSLHGIRFGAIFKYGTILATQFHPEKSKTIGDEILKYWINSTLQPVN